MTVFTKTAVDIFAAQDSSGAKRKVANHDVQVWGTEVERAIKSFQAGGGVVFDSKTEADGSLDYNAYTMAWIFDDDPSLAGIYQKQGASGSGSWQRVGDLPYSFILATNTNSGDPNAIEATTPVAIPAADGGALIALPIVADNTGSPVTVSFNGGPALTVKTIAGNDVPIAALADGMIIWGFKSGDEFRLVTDLSSAGILAGAEAAAEAAENAADRAQSYSAMLSADKIKFKTVAALLADDTMSYDDEPGKIHVGPGDVVEAQGFRYEVAADDATDAHVETAGGVWLYVRSPTLYAWGVVDGTDQTALVQTALDYAVSAQLPYFDWTCDIKISAPLSATTSKDGPFYTGILRLEPTEHMDQCITLNGGHGRFGDITIFTPDGNHMENRRARHGVLLNGVRRSIIGKIECLGVKRWAVYLDGVNSNCNLSILTTIVAESCGSNWPDGSVSETYTNKINVTSVNHTGNPNSYQQTSELTCSGDMPEIVPHEDFVVVGDDLHIVESVDNNIVTVFPWVDLTSGELPLIQGGGLNMVGNSANASTVDMMDVRNSGIGYRAGDMLGSSVESLVNQWNGIGLVLGRHMLNTHHSTSIGRLYNESTSFDIVSASLNMTKNVIHTFLHGADTLGGLGDRSREMKPKLAPENAMSHGCRGWSAISAQGIHSKLLTDSERTVAEIQNGPESISRGAVRRNNIIIGPVYNEVEDRTFNRKHWEMVCFGSNPNQIPASVIVRPEEGFSINGGAPGADFEFDTVESPIVVYGYKDPNAANWLVAAMPLIGASLPGSED